MDQKTERDVEETEHTIDDKPSNLKASTVNQMLHAFLTSMMMIIIHRSFVQKKFEITDCHATASWQFLSIAVIT